MCWLCKSVLLMFGATMFSTTHVETATAQPLPQIVYINGKVITVDSQFRIAQAFAVGGNRFIAVGSNDELQELAGQNVRVVNLRGRVVLPGFVDAHAHTITRKFGGLQRVSLSDAHSVKEILRRVADASSVAAPGAWIVTTAIGKAPDFFDLPESLEERRWPNLHELDAAAPRNPVYIPVSHNWPTPSIFNSTALMLLNVTRDTTDEGRVRVNKNTLTGEPDGLIYGLDRFSRTNALYVKLQAMVPKTPPELQQEAVKQAMVENLTQGITSLYEAHANQPVFLQYLRSLYESGELRNRVVFAYEIPVDKPITEIDRWMGGIGEAAQSGSGDDMLTVLGATVSMDGAVQFGRALMTMPYLNPYGELANGESSVTTQELIEIGRLAVKHNLRLNVQAAGDLAGEMAVTALEAVHHETPIDSRRWVIQHFQHPSRDEIMRLKALGIDVQTYSAVDFSKGAATYVDRFPGQPDLWKSVVPLRWWLDAGVAVAQSTDGAHISPMFTLWQSLVRVDGRTGNSMLTPQKTISREEAIRMYTINGARAMLKEDRLGSIEAGKLADFVVLDSDILTISVEQIPTVKVVATALGGEIVFGSLH